MNFPFEVHTPSRLFFKDLVEAVILTTGDGDIEIMAGHCNCTAPVKTGFLKIKNSEGKWRNAFTSDGIIEVTQFKTILMSDAVEWGNEIDRNRALEAKAKAEKSLLNGMMKFETDKAAAALKRAEFRLKICGQEK